METTFQANNLLSITYVPTGLSIEFQAALETLSDAYTVNWTAEEVFGRMDPISTYKNTTRALALAWTVAAGSYEEAEDNLFKINKLMNFTYPLYDGGGVGSTSISQSPLVRISFGNLVRSASTGEGLLGWLHGFTFDPVLEHGMFNNGGTQYYPKSFRLNCELTVLHDHELGFKISPAMVDNKTYWENANGNVVKRVYNYSAPYLNPSNYPYLTSLPVDSVRSTFEVDLPISTYNPLTIEASLASAVLTTQQRRGLGLYTAAEEENMREANFRESLNDMQGSAQGTR